MDRNGNRYCILNEPPSLSDYAASQRLILNSRSKSYGLTKQQAKELATQYGIDLPNCPDFVTASEKDEQLILEAKGKAEGWREALDELYRRFSTTDYHSSWFWKRAIEAMRGMRDQRPPE